MSEQRLQDIATLTRSALLSALSVDEAGVLLGELTLVDLPRGGSVEPAREGEPALHFILDGEVELEDGHQHRARLVPSEAFGMGALVGRATYERAVACVDARLARLSRPAYAALARTQPRAALHLVEGALRILAERLQSAGSAVERQAALARGPQGTLRAGSPVHGNVDASGARIGDLLPSEMAGALVVAARAGERLLPLHASTDERTRLIPVTTREWEGRDIYRRSAGLVLLEAARQLGVSLQLGPSLSSGRLVLLTGEGEKAAVARAIDERLAELCRSALPIEEELWSVQDAIELFRKQDDPSACLLLEDSLEPVVTLLRFGDTWAFAPRPLLPHAGLLQDVHVLEHPLGLLLDFGGRIRDALARPATSTSPTLALELRAPRYGAAMTRSGEQWLKLLGVENVGTFNRVCVHGKVPELIRVSEGFHEKRIAEIADQIKLRPGTRVVAVAGPSSSGKTTFIKRLVVQLRINGIEPLELSLDDYYIDRDKQPRDAAGQIDFEILEALDLPRLRAHLETLTHGGTVRPPRFDFLLGRSLPEAGPELRLGDRSVLLLEGIHALNPALYAGSSRSTVFNIFIHPATSLAFDRLSSLEPADVRLLRRIVRDRHQRGHAAVDTLARWSSVRRGERLHIFPFQGEADAVFDSSLVYEVSVLRVYAERYLLEVPRGAPEAPSARRLRRLLQLFVPIHPDHVPSTSLLREFIGGSGFTY